MTEYILTTSPPAIDQDGRGLGRSLHHLSETVRIGLKSRAYQPVCGSTQTQAPAPGAEPTEIAEAHAQLIGIPLQWRCETCWDRGIRIKHPRLQRASL